MADPLFTLGARRTSESLFEALVPMGALGWAVWASRRFLLEPSVSRSLNGFELAIVVGAVACVIGWYAGRQSVIMGARKPWKMAVFGWIISMTALVILSQGVVQGFQSSCEGMGGVVLEGQPLGDVTGKLCQIGSVPGNPYLPGTLLRPTWDGRVTVWLALWVSLLSVLATVAFRHTPLRRSKMGGNIAELLRLAPAAGYGAVSGDAPAEGKVQACANSTLWGELCGQLYAAEKVFEPGEWCIRCTQAYRRTERELRFDVVSLFTADIDVLNGLERLDANSWEQGQPIPPDARLSGQERWVTLGSITVPDVITVATLLSMVHTQLKGWSKNGDEHSEQAYKLAEQRASRVAAWIWFGEHSRGLTYARPTNRVLLVHGPARLRDLGLEIGEDLTLQLDIGFIPLELRTGFRQTFLATDREPIQHNAKQDLWIPVTGSAAGVDGLWLPRIEGEALRAWLALDRLRPATARGVTTPLPYVPAGGAPSQGSVRAGTVDLVRMPIDPMTGEAVLGRRPGDSITEWEWMQSRMLELLRQEALVMVAE